MTVLDCTPQVRHEHLSDSARIWLIASELQSKSQKSFALSLK